MLQQEAGSLNPGRLTNTISIHIKHQMEIKQRFSNASARERLEKMRLKLSCHLFLDPNVPNIFQEVVQ